MTNKKDSPVTLSEDDNKILMELKDFSENQSHIKNEYIITSSLLDKDITDNNDSDTDSEIYEIIDVNLDGNKKNNMNLLQFMSLFQSKVNDKIDDDTNKKVKKILGQEKYEQLIELEKKLDDIEDDDSNIPIKYKILLLDMPLEHKSKIYKKYLEIQEMTNSEYSKWNAWLNGLLKIPFGIYHDYNINTNCVSDVSKFILNCHKILDDSVYGHQECKDYLIQMIAQFMVKNTGKGTAIGLQGPPGNGKTSLIRDGVSKALNRPFHMIPLGGMTDGSHFEGHSFTYEGSTWGRLAQILMDAKCMNPIIFFDELDKVSESTHGNEIVGILTHLIDFTQNDKIYDKYFADISLDFSKCIFIFSFNDEQKINPILKDRLHIIKTNQLSKSDKLIIAKKYMIPRILENVNLSEHDLIFTDDIVEYIFNKYTSNEEGVRDFKRKFECIIMKFNLLRLLEPEKYKVPHNVSKEFIDIILQTPTFEQNNVGNKIFFSMYM